MADEMSLGGQVRENALTAVGAIAGDDDLVVWEPLGHQLGQFEGEFRSGAMIGILFEFGGLPFALLPLCEPLAVAVQTHGYGQSKDFGGTQNGFSMIRQSTTQSCPQLTRALDLLEMSGS